MRAVLRVAASLPLIVPLAGCAQKVPAKPEAPTGPPPATAGDEMARVLEIR